MTRRHRFGLLLLLAGMAAPSYPADRTLPAKTHREAWKRLSDGSIVKDFEWKVQPSISAEAGVLTVHLAESLTKHADGFAGVIGEMDFASGAFQSLTITFGDGTSATVDSGDARFEAAAAKKTIARLVAHYELVGRKWTLEWNGGGTEATDPGDLPLPPGWSLATNSLGSAGSTAGDPKKGTWLTPSAMRDRPQDMAGMWILKDAGTAGSEPRQVFEAAGGVLRVHNLSDPKGFWVYLTRLANSTRWEGSGAVPGEDGTGFSTCPVPKGTCLQLCKWSAGFLDIPAGALQANGEWRDRHVDSTKCVHTDEPQIETQEFDRFVGVSFAPIQPGKYLYLGMAPGVGPNPAQFKALVRVAANYSTSGAASVKTSVKPATASLTRSSGGALQGVYEFAAHGRGVYELTFELARRDGSVFHTDRMRIEVPAIPGLGN